MRIGIDRAAQVGRSPWTARDAFVPLPETRSKAPAPRNTARPYPPEPSTYAAYSNTGTIPAMKHGRRAGIQVVVIETVGAHLTAELLGHLELIRPITWPWPAVPNPAKPTHPCMLEDKLSGLEPRPLWPANAKFEACYKRQLARRR